MIVCPHNFASPLDTLVQLSKSFAELWNAVGMSRADIIIKEVIIYSAGRKGLPFSGQ